MKGIIVFLILALIPSIALCWTDVVGDTMTTTGADLDPKDIANMAFDRGTDSFKVELTSGNVTVTGSSVVVTNFPSDYPDSVSQSSLSSMDGNLEHCDTNDIHIGSGTVSDSRYIHHASTGVAGKLNSTADISVTASSVTFVTFYSDGGDTTITTTFTSGTIYSLDGIPFSMEFPIPIAAPTFQCTLPADTTFYYFIPGVVQQ